MFTIPVFVAFCFIGMIEPKSCTYEVDSLPQLKWFQLNSTPLPSVSHIITVLSNGDLSCILDVDSILSECRFPNETISYGIFVFLCTTYVHITLNFMDHGTVLSNVIGHVEIQNCSFTTENIDIFLNMTNSRVLSLIHFQVLKSLHRNISFCDGLRKLSMVYITNPVNDVMESLEGLFYCQKIFPEVRALKMIDCSGTLNQTSLKVLFPNVQRIEVFQCKITGKLIFPWSHHTFHIFDNLSRTDYLEDEYINKMHVNIPENVFVRQLKLIKNEIQNPTQVQINGSLHSVIISGNNISKLSKMLLANAYDVQAIILSENSIHEIEDSAFSGKHSLKYLDVNENELHELPLNVFDDLSALIFLNLSNNNIEKLPRRIFFNLRNLKILKIANNRLHEIDQSVLPIYSANLQYLNFNHNPLQEMPVSIYYIKNIKSIKLGFTNISFGNLTSFLEKVDYYRLVSALLSLSGDEMNPRNALDPLKTTKNWRVIDLTGSNITGFQLTNFSSTTWTNNVSIYTILTIILKHFQFVLTGNPLTCFSDIVPFNSFMKGLSAVYTGQEYFYHDWLCQYPREFLGRPVLQIKADETYKKITDKYCPNYCECYLRYNQNITIVDCRELGFSSMPEDVPSGIIDMWMEHNNISSLAYREYFYNIRHLLLSDNGLEKINPDVFNGMGNLKVLKLDINLLTQLPNSIVKVNLDILFINNNPLICDCNTLWLKYWLLTNNRAIQNLKYTTCQSEAGKASQFIAVPDDEFTCTERTIQTDFTVPIAVTAVVVLIVVFTTFLVYIYRQEIKVLLYIKFEWHFFDRGYPEEHEDIDLTVLHNEDSCNFVTEHIREPLKELDFVVYSASHDFIAGYSLQENIASAVYRSKHILLVLSNNLLAESKIIDYIWNECKCKIQTTRSNFLIVTTVEDVNCLTLKKELRKYLKLHQYLQSHNRMFLSKIKYILSSYQKVADCNRNQFHELGRGLIYSANEIQNAGEEYDLFITYSNRDQAYCQKNLIRRFKKQGYKVSTPDTHFHPGARVLTNVSQFVESSSHTIFVTSCIVPLDEIQLFIFENAIARTRRLRYNHLIVVFLGAPDEMSFDNELKAYVDSYVCLNTRDVYFWRRLKTALLPKIAD